MPYSNSANGCSKYRYMVKKFFIKTNAKQNGIAKIKISIAKPFSLPFFNKLYFCTKHPYFTNKACRLGVGGKHFCVTPIEIGALRTEKKAAQ